ncbi:site-specific DNA-methyltransferase [Arenicella chitinivorans]|nr:site-specific DNA-methyltransferase [Arenicella chitinivorans]
MKKVELEDGQSADIVSENISKLKELFPDAFSEGGVNFDTLRQLLGDASVLDEGEEKYGLNWHGKKKARQIALTPSTGTLLPCPDESVDWDTTQNLFIEGDNLEVLKLLQKSYANKVKMIYIDPPYNTGKEFIYPDKFQENLDTYLKYTGQVDDDGVKFSSNTETTGRKHANWLSMMYPRLRLAKNLLQQDGVIFISIDDNEQSNLKKICDEIFGEENFIDTVIWQKVYAPKSSAKHFSQDHDFILVYAKNSDEWMPGLLPRTEAQNSKYKNPDDDPRGPWRPNNLAARNYYSKGTYSITCPSGRVVEGPPRGLYWKYSEEKFWEMDKDNRIWWGQDGNNVPAPKIFLSEVMQGRVPQTLWKFEDVGHTQEAKRDLVDKVEFATSGSVFETPKPTRLIKRMLQIGCPKEDPGIVLDFFSGSCSTADAVFQLNLEEGVNRRFIMVQLPEPTGYEDYETIADIGKTRIKSSASRIRIAAENAEDLLTENVEVDVGFRVFKLGGSNIQAWNPDRTDLEASLLSHEEHLIEGRTEQDVLYELLLKRGVDLAVPIESREVSGKNIYSIGYGVLFACLDESISREQVEDIAQAIIAWHGELAPSSDTHVFFRDSAFRDDVSKTNMAAILEQNGITHVRSL